MLHTLRQLLEDDEKWRTILRGLNKEFFHQMVTTAQIENYMSEQSGIDLSAFFNQYLRDTRIPVLAYVIDGNKLTYKWDQIVKDFDMPIIVEINGKAQWIYPASQMKELEVDKPIESFKIDADFYVAEFNLRGR